MSANMAYICRVQHSRVSAGQPPPLPLPPLFTTAMQQKARGGRGAEAHPPTVHRNVVFHRKLII